MRVIWSWQEGQAKRGKNDCGISGVPNIQRTPARTVQAKPIQHPSVSSESGMSSSVAVRPRVQENPVNQTRVLI